MKKMYTKPSVESIKIQMESIIALSTQEGEITGDNKDDFEFFADLLWNAYNTMRTRVPMTDWYDTVSGRWVSFRHRTVQGGLFMRVLMNKWHKEK